MTPALTQLPPLSRGTAKPNDFIIHEEKTLSARAALAVWVGLSTVGWAAIAAFGYWVV